MVKIPFPCAIFAGGKSRRMGEDKTLLPLGQSPSLVEYQIRRLNPFVDEIVVVAKNDKFRGLTKKLIKDRSEVFSPMVGLIALFEETLYHKVLVIAADTPFVSPQTLMKLCCEVHHHDDVVVLQTGDKIHPLCGVYDRRILTPLQKSAENDQHKMTLFLESVVTRYVQAGSAQELSNLNTPQEYMIACERIQQ